MNIILSGFEPFGENPVNPSSELILAVRENPIPGHRIHTLILPVIWNQVWEPMLSALDNLKPDLVIAFGLKSGSDCITLETRAHNWNREIKDNSGETSLGKIENSSPEYINSTLPLQLYFQKLKNQNIPVSYSNDAGGYLCNHLFYRIQSHLLNNSSVASGFIHLPAWPVNEGNTCLYKILQILLMEIL
ncbi:MAG: pyroglutamyl-peptidase I [Candidatus Cloacimonetes bacterium]|nr:pyroglutamyl-peptidase I [Candidatus Cloacimonadota bacterium]